MGRTGSVVRNFHVGTLMSSGGPIEVLPAPPVSDGLAPREELVRVRAGPWRLLLPMRFVERVLGAALPAASPGPAGDAPPVVAVGEALVPLLFAHALLGAEEVRLDGDDQMVLLRDGDRRALLWVDAVEEVEELVRVPSPGGTQEPLVAAWSGPERPLAVLDVPRLLELAA